MAALEVSVLMPVLDGAATIRTAIDSALAQQRVGLELIVVDDGSRDATAAIVGAVGDARIRLLRNPVNQGIPAALGRALAAARAPLLARLDADDRWHPGYLAAQLAALAAAPGAALVSCWTREVDGAGREVGASRPDPAPGFAAWELTHRNALYPSASVVRAAAVRAVGGFRGEFAVAEDHDLWTRLVMAGGEVAVLPRTLVDYRRGGGVTAATAAATARRLGLAVRRAYVEWLLGRGVETDALAAFDDLSAWRATPAALGGEALRRAAALAGEVSAAAQRRFGLPRATRRAIDRRLAAVWLHHAGRLVVDAPADAAFLARSAVGLDRRLLRRRSVWSLLSPRLRRCRASR